MNKKYLTVLILLVCICIAVFGYIYIKSSTPEEIRDNVMNALNNVETYKFNMDVVSWEDNIATNGEVNLKNKNARLNVDVTSEGMTMPMVIYVMNDISYLRMFGKWTKKSLTNSFEDEDYLKSQMEIIKHSEIDLIKEDENFYVLSVKPSEREKILEYITKRADINVHDSENANISMKVWIEKSDNLPRTIEIKAMADDVHLNIINDISEYNKPLEIKLPGEAETAKWVSEM